jgi:hypothetical protein
VQFPPANTTTVTRVVGSVTYPGKNGGDATFSINVTRSLLGAYSGSVSFTDASANHQVTGQVNAFTQVRRFGLNGAQGTARLSDGQTFQWRVDDLSAINLGRDDIGTTAPSGYSVDTTSTAGDITVLPSN